MKSKGQAAPLTLEEAKQRMPEIWVIYDRPTDFPDEVVVVNWWGDVRDHVVAHCETVQEARKIILGLGATSCLMRDPRDESQIVESWI